MINKQETLGQYWTKPEIVEKLLSLLFSYKNYNEDISILEPSFGTGNFLKELENKNFKKTTGFEIDEELTKNPTDFFDVSLKEKFDLVVGNPPFTKYNLKDSYYYFSKYKSSKIDPNTYLEKTDIKKDKQKVENAFIYKSLKHLKNKNSTIAFVLPISFFIKNRNKKVKEKIKNSFSTIIIYQNDQMWFDKNIPCGFAIFTNIENLKNKIIIVYENGKINKEVFDFSEIHEELIPQVIFHKNNGYIKNKKGIPLNEFLSDNRVKISKSFKENNVSAKNILDNTKIPEKEKISDYKMAVVRVGNSSVGKCGLINVKKDILNDMFYVFDFKEEFDKDKKLKENICEKVNNNIDYFRNITCRVGSKSIKKENILDFKVEV